MMMTDARVMSVDVKGRVGLPFCGQLKASSLFFRRVLLGYLLFSSDWTSIVESPLVSGC
jgi:hypothetical protein